MPRAFLTALLTGAGLLAGLQLAGGADPAAETDPPRPAGQPAGAAGFDVCDVSYLWPVPETADDARALVGADASHPTTGAAVWPEAAFKRALEIAEGDAAAVADQGGTTLRIKLPAALRDRAVWKVAGVRVDGGAPGGHSAVVAKFGAAPQVRVILQPVTVAGGSAVVHDVAAHLVYNFVKAPLKAETGFVPVNVPDREAFGPVVAGLAGLKARLKAKGVDTAGAALGVHPGLTRPARAAGFDQAVRAFLLAHVREERLTAMAVMGLPDPAPEPWVFVGMRKTAAGYDPAPLPVLGNKAAQMISFLGPTPRVAPAPLPTNRNPITNFLATPPADRRGVATASLFEAKLKLDDPAVVGRAADGTPVLDPGGEYPLRNRDIPDLIANPAVAHFFNTDCVSCHTESTRRVKLMLPAGSRFEYVRPKGVSGVDPAVLPAEDWNVRNFGWFPSPFTKTTRATVTMRTANETAECVEFINREYRGRTDR